MPTDTPPTRSLSESIPVRAISLVALLVLACLLLGTAIHDIPFHTKGEPREALVIQTMFEQQHYVLALRNGDEIPSKPPLFHWIGTLAANAHGSVTEYATRLPSTLAALWLIGLVTLLGFRWWGTVAGIAAGTALLSTQQFIASATTARVDMVLAACVAVAVASGGIALQESRRIPLIFYFACALGVLAKGPVGGVLPIAILTTYAVAARRIPGADQLRLYQGFAIALIPLAWYVAAWWVGGQEFLDKLLLKENFYRVLDADAVGAGHVRPLWFYGPALLGSGAPWSLCLPSVVATAWRRRANIDEARLLLPLVWIAVTVILFSLAGSKRSVYLLPCFPALALLVGQWVTASSSKEPVTAVLRAACLAVAGILASAIALIALQAAGVPALGWLEPLVGNQADRANLATLMEIATAMRIELTIWAALAATLLAAATRSVLLRNRLAGFAAVAGLITLTVTMAGIPMQREMAKRQSLEPFIARVAPAIEPEEPVYFYGLPDYSAVYYLHRPITPVENATLTVGRNRAWYFVWERSVDELCTRLHALDTGKRRLSCREHDRYDFFGNPKRDDLVLIALERRRRARADRPGNSP